MLGEYYYPEIQYFQLTKDIPSAEAGDIVTIIDADGRECLLINRIEMPIETAKNHPEWFSPVTKKTHVEQVKSSLLKHYMSLGKTEAEALNIINNI